VGWPSWIDWLGWELPGLGWLGNYAGWPGLSIDEKLVKYPYTDEERNNQNEKNPKIKSHISELVATPKPFKTY
jgi:hypothetical protein